MTDNSDQGRLDSQDPLIRKVKELLSDPGWKPDVAEFARKEFWEGVEDLVHRRYRNNNERALYERLINRPEMQSVWNTLFNWLIESGSFPLSSYSLVPGRLASFAARLVGNSPIPAAITLPQRKVASEKISKHAKLLANELRKNNFPASVFFFFSQDDLKSLIRNLLAYVGYEADDELLQTLDCESHDMPSSEREWLNSIVDSASIELIQFGSVLTGNPSLSIYQMLAFLADDDAVLESIPPVEVEGRGKSENSAPRRELIRNLARWMAITLGRDAKKELTFMADLVGVVFDDYGIDEQFIKDGLKNYRYMP